MSSSRLLTTVFCGFAARNGEKHKKIKEDETRVNSRQNASVEPAARLKKIRVTSFGIIADGSTRHASCNATRWYVEDSFSSSDCYKIEPVNQLHSFTIKPDFKRVIVWTWICLSPFANPGTWAQERVAAPEEERLARGGEAPNAGYLNPAQTCIKEPLPHRT